MSKFAMKPGVKITEDKKIEIDLAGAYDGNEDGQPSVEAGVSVKLDAAELVQELAKKDLPWLNGIIASVAPKAE